MPTLRPPVGGNEESQAEGGSREPSRLDAFCEELTVAYVRVEHRNARLAAGVRLDVVQGKDGLISKGTAVAISNVKKRGEEEATSIQWTFWGKLAESAAEYLGKGSRVNIVGRVQNNNYTNADGQLVYGLTFTCEELDYLDSRAEAEARRARQEGGTTPLAPAAASVSTKGSGRTRTGSKPAAAPGPAKGIDPDDIPF